MLIFLPKKWEKHCKHVFLKGCLFWSWKVRWVHNCLLHRQCTVCSWRFRFHWDRAKEYSCTDCLLLLVCTKRAMEAPRLSTGQHLSGVVLICIDLCDTKNLTDLSTGYISRFSSFMLGLFNVHKLVPSFISASEKNWDWMRCIILCFFPSFFHASCSLLKYYTCWIPHW